MAPAPLHSRSVVNLIRIFDSHGLEVFPEITIAVGDKTMDIDLAVTKEPFQWNPDDISTKFEIIPYLCIEILSPKQSVGDLIGKAMTLIKEGLLHYWLVSPYQETVTVFISSGDDYTRKTFIKEQSIPNPFNASDKNESWMIVLDDVFK